MLYIADAPIVTKLTTCFLESEPTAGILSDPTCKREARRTQDLGFQAH